jgi:hypothetical protein
MRRLVLGAFVCGLLAGTAPAWAQMSGAPPSPEASEIAACLCLHRSIDALRGETTSSQAAYDSLRSEVARADTDLARERSRIDVNNPESVARFRQLLERRDALARRSTGQVADQSIAAADRYNRRISEYNARCANRPRDPRLLEHVQATLSCPAY